MIYMVSDNFYLCEGIEKTMYPLHIMKLSTPTELAQALPQINDLDVLVIDSNFNCDYSNFFNARNERVKIVVLNSSRHQIENFNTLDSLFYIINIRITIAEFRAYLLSAMAGRMGPNLFCSRLTTRERFVLKESLKGLTVKEIASINSIPEKSVYAQRLTACRKLGFTSHRAIWELPLSTVQGQL